MIKDIFLTQEQWEVARAEYEISISATKRFWDMGLTGFEHWKMSDAIRRAWKQIVGSGKSLKLKRKIRLSPSLVQAMQRVYVEACLKSRESIKPAHDWYLKSLKEVLEAVLGTPPKIRPDILRRVIETELGFDIVLSTN